MAVLAGFPTPEPWELNVLSSLHPLAAAVSGEVPSVGKNGGAVGRRPVLSTVPESSHNNSS